MLKHMTVKAWLGGNRLDLAVLAELLPTGDVRVVQEADGYYLAASALDGPSESRKVYEVAPELLRRVNGIARAMRPNDYRPVNLTGLYQIGEDQLRVVQAGAAEVRLQALPATVVVVSAELEARTQLIATGEVLRNGQPVVEQLASTKGIALAAQHADVAEVLTIMGQDDLNFVDLYKVYEIVRDSLKPARLEQSGWVTK
jgi:hypothetical protein